jgi:glycerol-3-phosphate O-acyltransferase
MSTTTNEVATAYKQIKDMAVGSLQAKVASGEAPEVFVKVLSQFMEEYADSNLQANEPPEQFKENTFTFLKSVQQALKAPHQFEAFHKAIREPFDYYKWGNGFLKPLIIMDQSIIRGEENAKKIAECIAKGENVVLLSNHQTEADPQVISILLEKYGLPELAEKVIFIAGHKVTNDPVAIPFSMGRNLLCIHSKKHIKNPPEEISMKQAQNLASMKAMGDLATAGGNVFWVAPSGGRDRPDESGSFVVAPFDMKALDMFKLVGMQSGRRMHFFPMAMYTHTLVPPPKEVSSTLGETRSAKRGAVSIEFLDETDGLGGLKDKEFTAEVQQRVDAAYKGLVDWHSTHN